MNSTPVIILASASPFRKKALDVLGLSYEVIPSKINEKTIRDSNPHALAQKLSEAKARAVATKQKNTIVISADLFVTQNGKIFEKPSDTIKAKEMLNSFSGNELAIIASVSVFNSANQRMRSAVETCTVQFRKLNEHEIDDYIARYPVTRFAGAFEGDGLLRFASRINGNYNFHTGLPMNRLVEFLAENGLNV